MSGVIQEYYKLIKRSNILIFFSIFIFSTSLFSATSKDIELSNNDTTHKEEENNQKRITALKAISEVRESLQQEAKLLSRQLSAKMSAVQKKVITDKLDRLSQDLTNSEKSFEQIATGLVEQLILEGYQDDLINLSVEFGQSSTSSLDIVVLADFKGSRAPIYNRIRRSIQRWCVDACRINNGEIPFTQIVMHNTH